jgi:putative alpha-1,2-mannosidase
MKQADIQLENQKKFVITTHKKSDKDIYIASVTLNGKPYLYNYIHHSTIEKGGELVFTMQATPGSRGNDSKARPGQ